MIQSPGVMNPRFAPPQRAEYTVGVAGCGQRATYLVVCAEGGTGCIAAGTQYRALNGGSRRAGSAVAAVDGVRSGVG